MGTALRLNLGFQGGCNVELNSDAAAVSLLHRGLPADSVAGSLCSNKEAHCVVAQQLQACVWYLLHARSVFAVHTRCRRMVENCEDKAVVPCPATGRM